MWREILKRTEERTYDEISQEIEKADKEGIPGVIAPAKVLIPIETFNDSSRQERDVLKCVDFCDGSYTVLANQSAYAAETPPRIKRIEAN